jgi:heme/copper-type cytochrome/quinol oxidase subunit 2
VVELRISSLDTNHGFYLREAGVNVIVPKRGKGDARILFRAQKQGVFPFECSKACGAGHTIMQGRIVVE